MLPIKAWRIYYADGSVFDSTMGTWAEAPPFGAQCVVWYVVDGRKMIHSGKDVYAYEGDCDAAEPCKMGLWMDREGFRRIQEYARRSTTPEV